MFVFVIGAVYHHLKDYSNAEDHYQKSLALNPSNRGTIENYKRLRKVVRK